MGKASSKSRGKPDTAVTISTHEHKRAGRVRTVTCPEAGLTPVQEKNDVVQTQTIRNQTSQKKNVEACVSIDFGTIYTGYSFSFTQLSTYMLGETKKIPTVVLMDHERKLAAFGSEATIKYLELCETNQHEGWYLFERFKMALFVQDKPLDKDIEIEDTLGKKLKAIDVFTEAIKFIKTEIMSSIRNRTMSDKTKAEETSEADIHWVLTVPAIWNDLSKTFMRDAAIKAGIPSEVLTLALEPEVASVCCKKQLRYEKTPGHRYIVLDLGGGTADIVVHEVNPDGTLKELHNRW